jgi:hypothetical protein
VAIRCFQGEKMIPVRERFRFDEVAINLKWISEIFEPFREKVAARAALSGV